MTNALLQRCRLAMLAIVVAGPPLDQIAADRSQVADRGRTVTVRGCVRSWDGSPTGVGRGEAGPNAQYVLTKAEESPAPARVGASGAGTPPPSTTPLMAHDTYVLQPPAHLELRPFLDQQVEITGTLEVTPPHGATARGSNSADATPSSGAAVPQGGAARPAVPGSRAETTAPPAAPMQRVLVTELKTIAKTCP